MQLGRVVGSLVATVTAPGLEGVPLLVVQPLTTDLAPRGTPVIAADGTACAGRGELVYFVASREAALALRQTFVPVDHAIVGIADAVALAAPESEGAS